MQALQAEEITGLLQGFFYPYNHITGFIFVSGFLIVYPVKASSR